MVDLLSLGSSSARHSLRPVLRDHGFRFGDGVTNFLVLRSGISRNVLGNLDDGHGEVIDQAHFIIVLRGGVALVVAACFAAGLTALAVLEVSKRIFVPFPRTERWTWTYKTLVLDLRQDLRQPLMQ